MTTDGLTGVVSRVTGDPVSRPHRTGLSSGILHVVPPPDVV